MKNRLLQYSITREFEYFHINRFVKGENISRITMSSNNCQWNDTASFMMDDMSSLFSDFLSSNDDHQYSAMYDDATDEEFFASLGVITSEF